MSVHRHAEFPFQFLWIIAAAIAAGLPVISSQGGVNFSPTADIIESPAMSGEYILTVPTNHVGTYSLTVSGDNPLVDSLDKLTVVDPRNPGYGSSDGVNTGTPDVTITVDNLFDVSSIVLDTGAGESFVRVVVGSNGVTNVGELRVSEFHGSGEIFGNVIGPIELTNLYIPSGANTRRQIDSITIGGDFLGDLLIRGHPEGVWPGGYAIVDMTVLGNIGSPTNPVLWQVDGFLEMRGGGFHGDLHFPDDPTRGPSVQNFRMNQANGSGDIADGTLVFGKLQRLANNPGMIYASGNIAADIKINLNLDKLDVPLSVCGVTTSACNSVPFCECCYEDWGRNWADGLGVNKISGQIVIGSNADPIPEPNPTLFDGGSVDASSCPTTPPFDEVKWEGDVFAGSVVIDPVVLGTTNYPNTSASIGGGSIGIPPFGLHVQELGLEPGYMSRRLVPTAVNPLRIVHYGPVEWDALEGEPLFIEMRECDDEEGWVAVAPTEYSVSYTLDGPLRMIELAFDDPLIGGNDYRIRPVTPELMATLTTGYAYLWSTQDSSQEISVQDWEVVYSVGTCLADLNNDGVVDTTDLGILLGEFGQAGDPGALLSDVNNDGVVDTNDLGILLGEFGNNCDGCPGGQQGMMMMGGGMAFGECGGPLHPAVQFLGFNDPCEYSAFVQSLSGDAITAHALMLIDALEAVGSD